MGQLINKWIPYNPSYSCLRKYVITNPPSSNYYPEDITFNDNVNANETVELKASNSIMLTNGFNVYLGGIFSAETFLKVKDVACNPSQ